MNPLASILDLSSSALSAVETVLRPPGAAPAERRSDHLAGDPMLAALSAMTNFATATIDFLPRPDRSRRFAAVAAAPTRIDADLRSLMVRTFVITAGSSLRYWRNLAELYARKATLLRSQALRAFGELPAAQAERLLLDELRAFFRELVEVGLTEAARLGAELEQIGAAVLDAAGPAEPSGMYRRRWKAKD